MLRVLLVEDEAWVRDAVASVLEDPKLGSALVAACSSGAGALAKVANGAEFDVGLVDLGLPDMSGADLIRALRTARPGAVLVAFTVHDDAPTVLAALRAGARGYLLKSLPADRLVPALMEARAGGAPLSPAIARLVVDTLTVATGEPEAPSGLTPRETDVLALLAKGVSYAEVGRALGIALGTVQTHVRSIYEKLEICSKAEAAVVAVRLGLV